MEMVGFAYKILEIADEFGLDDCEVLMTRTQSFQYRIINKEITPEISDNILNIGIRILKDGMIGYLSITEMDEDDLRIGFQNSVRDLKPTPIRAFTVLSERIPELKIYDEKIMDLLEDPKRVKDLTQVIINRTYEADKDKEKLESLEGSVALQCEERLIHTKHSKAPVINKRTLFSYGVVVNSKDFEFYSSRSLLDLEVAKNIGVEVYNNLLVDEQSPDQVGAKGKEIDVLLHPICLESILRTLISEQIYASAKQVGLSRYSLGEEVAGKRVTLIDDGTVDNLIETSPTDDEGTLSRRNVVIEKGVLKTFLYDRITATKDSVISTGNGKRRPILIEDEHESPVRCGLRNLIMEPGEKSLEEIINGIKLGVEVKSLLGLHTANKTTGDFSNTVFAGRVIENGKYTAMVESGTWGLKGNAIELLKNVIEISKETKNTGSAVLPWIKVKLYVS